MVDASQGVEAQTLANTYLALDHNLQLIPILNKIDLPGAEPERVMEEIEQSIGLETDNAILISAKQGVGIEEVLESIVRLVPPPSGDPGAPPSIEAIALLTMPRAWRPENACVNRVSCP